MSVGGYNPARALRRTAVTRYKRVMQNLFRVLLLQLALFGGSAQSRVPAPTPPATLYGELYQRVQGEKLFADGKTFADAIARRDPAQILADYQRQKAGAEFSLRDFVAANFTIPGAAQSDSARSSARKCARTSTGCGAR
jgi:neutral trehalase